MEEEDVRGDRGLSVFRLRAVSRLTLVVRCTEIGYSVSTQVLCVVGFLFGCCWFCVLLLGVSAWWNRGTLDEVTKASFGRAVTGTAVMARSANEEKKKNSSLCRCFFEACRQNSSPAPRQYFKASTVHFFLARCCLGQVPGGAPFSQRSEQATACTNRMQIRN